MNMLFFTAAMLTALVSSPALSATFARGGDDTLRCVLTISGQIVEGDAQRFRTELEALITDLSPTYGAGRGERRLCLNSPGGSLSEAIEMADTLVFGYRVAEEFDVPDLHVRDFISSLGTAIPPNGICESACAVLFMAGGFFSDLGWQENWREPDRVMHISANLGFHAPGLVVEDGLYTEASVGSAFGVAVETIDRLATRLRSYRFPPSLFREMISTAPPELFYLETIAQAASWDISVMGAVRPATPTLGNHNRVCQNLVLFSQTHLSSDEVFYNANVPDDLTGESLGIWSGSYGTRVGHPESQPSESEEAILFNESEYDSATERYNTDVDGIECSAAFRISWDSPSLWWVNPSVPTDLGLNPRSMENDAYRTAMLPGYLTLADLRGLGRQYPSGEMPRDALLPPLRDAVEGFCIAYEDGFLVDQATCTAEYESRLRVDHGGSDDLLRIAWPTGDETVIPLSREADFSTAEWRFIGSLVTGGLHSGSTFPADFVADGTLNFADRRSLLNACGVFEARSDVRCFLPTRIVGSDVPWYAR